MEMPKSDGTWKERIVGGYFLLVFCFLFIFFTQIHPLVIFDCDDWRYIFFVRDPFPKLHEWNPTRIFPECFMPLTGYFSAYVLMPLVGDYLHAVTYVVALELGLLITGYLYLFYRLVSGEDGGRLRAICGTTVFFALHFLILKTQAYDNWHLFWTYNLTCVYYYLMPTLMNASLVLWMLQRGRLSELYGRLAMMQRGLLWIVLYFAIFSNILHNIVSIAFLAAYSVWDFYCDEAWSDFRRWARSHWMELVILFLWLVCLFFEAHGGRAHEIGWADLPWRETLHYAGQIWPMTKHSVMVACFAIILFAAGVLWRGCRTQREQAARRQLLVVFACILLVFFYLFALCTKVNAWYILRVDVAFCYFFYFLLLTGLAMNAVARRYPVVVQGMPLLAVLVLLLSLNNPRENFRESIFSNVPAQICYDMGNDIIWQMMSADRAGKEEVVVPVAVCPVSGNYPLVIDLMERTVPQGLFRQGILQRQLKIHFQPDARVNQRYHLPVPLQEEMSKDPDRN